MNAESSSPSAPALGAIWARARGGVIGSQGSMPWHVPSDLAFFKSSTAGAPVIMGRATWESFPERFRPLPGRTNIVLTRSLPARPAGGARWATLDGALWCDDVDVAIKAALESCGEAETIWVIGGSNVYEQILDREQIPGVLDGRVSRVLVTELDVEVPGDRTAPPLGDEWTGVELDRGVDEAARVADGSGRLRPMAVPCRFMEYTRRSARA